LLRKSRYSLTSAKLVNTFLANPSEKALLER
jgi:hypothetical protein